MQILGKRSKILLIVIAIIMLIAVGVSFATWDNSAVKATNGDLSNYANAKVGDIIEFGRYYQTGIIDETTGEYEKTPIEWLVVDKDERSGQLTLMSKYILAAGSYFGNYYHNGFKFAWNYCSETSEVGGVPYNQAYVDSTARAFLNNLERLDMGGDAFSAETGYIPSGINSTNDGYDAIDKNKFVKGTGLLSSVGFSNQRYWTGYSTLTAPMLEGKTGIFKRADSLIDKDKNQYYEFYYQRPLGSPEYKARPATRGFLDEAFDETEKTMIVPKQIAGYIGHRWPDNAHDIATKSYVEGVIDKVWLPSATELNAANGKDWNGQQNDAWINPSDETGSAVFKYFKDYEKYGYSSVAQAVKATRTVFAKNSFAMNYSIPVYQKGTTDINTDIHVTSNSIDYYWTRSPVSYWAYNVRMVLNSGLFHSNASDGSHIGIRPCVILKY